MTDASALSGPSGGSREAAGRIRSSFATTEPHSGAGSDPAALTTSAEPAGGRWVVNGHKRFISGGLVASFFIVMARTPVTGSAPAGATMFLVDADHPGVRVGRSIPTIDRAIDGGHPHVHFEDCVVEESAVLGAPGESFRHAQVRLGPARLTHCMRWLGLARRANDIALDRVARRELFGELAARSRRGAARSRRARRRSTRFPRGSSGHAHDPPDRHEALAREEPMNRESLQGRSGAAQAMDAYTALTTTRAVRRRLDATRAVPRSIVEHCIEIASQAPTGGNHQRLRWVVVEDARLRARVVDAFREPAAERYGLLRDHAPTPDSRLAYEGALELLARLETIPVLAIPCMTGAAHAPAGHAAAVAFYGSAIPAVWSFQLALRTQGLGSTFTSVHLQREREVAEILGIPESVRQIALLPVAYTIGTGFKPAKRTPVDELVSYDGWSELPSGPRR